MDKGTGLTIIPHEDLVSAVKNWNNLRKLYNKVTTEASDHAHYVWKSKSWIYRTWCQVKSGIFSPAEWWIAYSDYFHYNIPKKFHTGIDHLPERCYTNDAMAAEDCEKHSLESGKHYLNARQVKFVNTFKNLEVGCE
jgi:hypothetical protein